MRTRTNIFGARDITCIACGKLCGRHYPATHWDPAFSEGPGEDFADSVNGDWHCSQKCLDKTEADLAPTCDRCGEPGDVWPRHTEHQQLELLCAACKGKGEAD